MQKPSHYYYRFLETTSRSLAKIRPSQIFDEIYIKAKYQRIFNKKLNLKTPKTFNEKIQWLKLNDRNPLYTQLSDKHSVREYIKEKINDPILNELYGVYDNVEIIDFNKFPNQFVLKATHGCNWNIICEKKELLDFEETKKILNKWLTMNFYNLKGEWVYKDIPPKIICEKYLSGDQELGLVDYKFYCFNGIPKFIQVDIDRFGNHKRSFYDEKWVLQDFSFDYPIFSKEIPKPSKFDQMLEIAGKISRDFNFCRIDLYSFDDIVVFGEITFYPMSGFAQYNPPEFDLILGNYLDINHTIS
jgi:hypothetical protein